MEIFGTIFDWILALFLFGLFLFIHELGHFLAARLTGVKVEEFGFGFPPRLIKLFTWRGTLFSLNAIPFGAFVRPVGEEDPNIEGGLAAAKKRVRVAVFLGGIFLNALAAVAAFTIAFKIAYPEGALVDGVAPESPAQQAGLQVGDVILSVDGVDVKNTSELIDYIHAHLGQEVTLHLERGGAAMDILVTPRSSWPEGQGPTGMTVAEAVSDKHGWDEAFGMGLQTIRDQLQLILSLPAKILRGGLDPALSRPVGPIGILDVTEQIVGTARENNRWVIILYWVGVINLALAFGNLLPIPALDGGHLLFILLELVRGKRVDPEKERMVHAYSMLALLGLMLFITYLDLFHPVLPR
jgi:regulator of sigma E protease